MSSSQIALVAHDAMKDDLIKWVANHKRILAKHRLYATGTTGQKLVEITKLPIKLLLSGPLGGDAQIGAMIAKREINVLIFFVDPLSAQPHDVDVKALIRLATLYNAALAVNQATADALMLQLRQ